MAAVESAPSYKLELNLATANTTMTTTATTTFKT